MALVAAKRKTKRATPRTKQGGKLEEPSWEGWESWSGQEYHKFKEATRAWYYDNYKIEDLIPAIHSYMEKSEKYTKDDIKYLKRVSNSQLGTTSGIIAKMLSNGMPAYNKVEAEYWEGLPGTMGTLKPSTEFLEKVIDESIEKGKLVVVEEKQKEEEEKKSGSVKWVPTIQERIREATSIMMEFVEEACDNFMYHEKITDFKDIKITNQLIQMGCKQPHARMIQSFYEPQIAELKEVINPPKLSKDATEEEKDWADQLKEGYEIWDKKKLKTLLDFLISVCGSCDSIIAQSKANRKPRKMSKKAPEQLVKKLKYKISDDKFVVSSIEPHKIIGANCLVVFNAKMRKLGIYYTSVEDPTGVGREGSGLNVKGTTLLRFNEETSVWCTLRKPMDQLQEVKTLNTRRKFENWFSKLTTTPVKMNGRINPETVLIAVY